jgi:predicted phage-related endonuclease
MTKKKKPITMTVEVPKPKPPIGIDSIKAALDSLEVSTGWQIIRRILDDNIKYLETAILEKIDPITKTSLTDEEVEKLRYKRSLNIEIKDTPKNYRQVLDDTGKAPKDFDPYFHTKKEIDQDKESSLTT